MKKIFLFCLLVITVYSAYSQDTVYVQAYYIQRFLKNDILTLRNRGESFETMIDYKIKQPFFFPVKINKKIPLWEKESIESILFNPDYQNTEVFYFCPFNSYIKSFFYKLNVPTDDSIKFPSQCNYYTHNKNSIYIYKIYYIEGRALRIKVENDYLNSQRNIDIAIKWELDPTLLSKNIPSFYAYLFYKCDTIKCDTPPDNFIQWNSTFENLKPKQP